MRIHYRRLSLLAFFFISLSSIAFASGGLKGKWIGSSDWNLGEVLIFGEGGKASLDGESFKYSVPYEGLVVYSDRGLDLEMTYTIQGDTLKMSLMGEEVTYRRALDQPPPPAPKVKTPVKTPPPAPNPTGARHPNKPSGNPLASGNNPLSGANKASAPPDPFLRNFKGGGLVLTLTSKVGTLYSGTLTFGEESWAISSNQNANSLSGTFNVGEESFPFTAKLTGDKLSFETGGNKFQLLGDPLPSGNTGIPPKLQKIADGPTHPWKHPRGWFSMELPQGWSIGETDQDFILINPGFKETDTLDAIILLTFGTLEKREQNLDVAELMTKRIPDFQTFFRDQLIQVDQPDGPAQKVLAGNVPGATLSWQGKAAKGQAVKVWTASVIKRNAFLTMIAIVLGENSDKYLPKSKQVFMSLQPNPPELNPQLMRAVAGRKLVLNLSGEGGTFFTTYQFSADRSVSRETMAGGITGGYDVNANSTLSGTWEVIGDELYMYFKDGQEGGQILLSNGAPAHVQLSSQKANFQ